MTVIKTITFDLDDTLWDLAPTLQAAERSTFIWLSQQLPEFGSRFTPQSFSHFRQQIYQQHPHLQHQISELRRVAVTEALRQAGLTESHARALSEQAFTHFIAARHEIELFNEVIPLLKALKPRYQLGVLTNGNADINRLMTIKPFFDFSFSAEQINSSKPAPELFSAALTHSNCQPEQLIHIGDHFEHDIQGAINSGCHAIWFNPMKKPPLVDNVNVVVVERLVEVIEAIEQIKLR